MTTGSRGEPSRFDDFADQGKGRAAGYFRGAEFSKLLVLLAIMLAGWALVLKYAHSQLDAAVEPPAAPHAGPPKVEPDRAPAFESVTDRTPIGLRDMAAYDLLLKRARETPAAALARQSQREIYFTHLWEPPRALPRGADPYRRHRAADHQLHVEIEPSGLPLRSLDQHA